MDTERKILSKISIANESQPQNKRLDICETGEPPIPGEQPFTFGEVLTREEEREIFESLDYFRNELANNEHEENSPEKLALENEISKLVDKITHHNQGLVFSIAHKYQNRGLPLADLTQEGNLGLFRAIERFEIDRGNKFSTYASQWVHQGMGRAIANQSRTVRIPVHMHDLMRKIYKTSEALLRETGMQPTDEEIAEMLDIPLEKVAHALNSPTIQTPKSLDGSLTSESDTTFGETIEDQNAKFTNEVEDAVAVEQITDFAIEVLSDKQFTVFYNRCVLNPIERLTLEEIAQELGITREGVRQLEKRALKKLQNTLTEHGINTSNI